MECYLVRHSNGELGDNLRAVLKSSTELQGEERLKLLKKYSLSFWYDLVKTLHDVNQKCTFPLVFWGLLIEYRGLSRLGRELQHFVGLGLHSRTYDRHKGRLLKKYELGVQDIVNSRQCVIAFDNYNHFYKKSDLSVHRTTQLAFANVTVCGVSRLPEGHGVPLVFEELFDDIDTTHFLASHTFLKSYEEAVSSIVYLTLTYLVPRSTGQTICCDQEESSRRRYV